MAEHPGRRPSAQHRDVVNAVGTGQHRMDQGEELATGTSRTGPLAKINQLVCQALQPKALGEGGRQQQASVGDRSDVVEGDGELVWGVRRWHRKGALLGRVD
jgi:hypothetical protein